MSLPETEGPMRAWLRARPSLSALVGTRVYFAVPEQDRPELPFLVFYRVGGLPDTQQSEWPDFIIEAWGQNKNEASNLAKTVAENILDATEERPVIIDGVKIEAVSVNMGPVQSGGVSWAKRYRVDASMRMRQS